MDRGRYVVRIAGEEKREPGARCHHKNAKRHLPDVNAYIVIHRYGEYVNLGSTATWRAIAQDSFEPLKEFRLPHVRRWVGWSSSISKVLEILEFPSKASASGISGTQ